MKSAGDANYIDLYMDTCNCSVRFLFEKFTIKYNTIDKANISFNFSILCSDRFARGREAWGPLRESRASRAGRTGSPPDRAAPFRGPPHTQNSVPDRASSKKRRAKT